MTTSSEETLLMVNNVKYKKNDGVLYVLNTRMGWMPLDQDSFVVNHSFSDVKLQKISPEGKSKIQLQVVLHDGNTSTFHFDNPLGQGAQIADRDSVKELLLQLLPKFKKKTNKELEDKNKMLSENPVLLQLYKELVITGIISSEEFWSQHAAEISMKQIDKKQQVGISGAFLSDIKPQTDGCNGLKYNLTADIIHSIFCTYPSVKKKHLECVPHKLSEAEFWKRFFQSHYFHRDRINYSSKDTFADCAKIDEKDMKNDISNGVDDPFLDLESFEDNSLGEGFGISVPLTSGSIAHTNIIRRFNHHSAMVLKSCSEEAEAEGDGCVGQVNGASNSEVVEPVTKKSRIHEKLQYEDLVDKEEDGERPFQLLKVERYFHGPTPVTDCDYISSADLLGCVQTVLAQTENWSSQLSDVANSRDSLTVIGNLSPGGSLMKAQSQNIARKTVSL